MHQARQNNNSAKEELTVKEVGFMALQIGFAVSATTVGCVLGGRWLDQRFQTAPTFVLLGMGLGLFLSLYLVWEIVKPLQKKYRKSGKR